MNFSNSLSVTSALSVVPFQEKLNTLSRSSTLSANHSCKPAGVLKKSYKIEGEHLTGYSNVNNCFLLINLSIVSLIKLPGIFCPLQLEITRLPSAGPLSERLQWNDAII